MGCNSAKLSHKKETKMNKQQAFKDLIPDIQDTGDKIQYMVSSQFRDNLSKGFDRNCSNILEQTVKSLQITEVCELRILIRELHLNLLKIDEKLFRGVSSSILVFLEMMEVYTKYLQRISKNIINMKYSQEVLKLADPIVYNYAYFLLQVYQIFSTLQTPQKKQKPVEIYDQKHWFNIQNNVYVSNEQLIEILLDESENQFQMFKLLENNQDAILSSSEQVDFQTNLYDKMMQSLCKAKNKAIQNLDQNQNENNQKKKGKSNTQRPLRFQDMSQEQKEYLLKDFRHGLNLNLGESRPLDVLNEYNQNQCVLGESIPLEKIQNQKVDDNVYKTSFSTQSNVKQRKISANHRVTNTEFQPPIAKMGDSLVVENDQ